MKKSEIYLKAQIAVVKTETVNVYEKLAILRELIQAENLALFSEEQNEKENNKC